MNRIVYILVSLMLTTVTLTAQEATSQNASGSEKTSGSESSGSGAISKEEKSNMSGMNNIQKTLYMQALSSNRNTKLSLIQEMEAGNIPVDENSFKALLVLSGDGTLYQAYTSSFEIAMNNSDIRMRAISLIGKLGTEEARKAIINVLNAESDPLVMGVSFRVLSNFAAPSDDGVQIRAINRAIKKDMVINANESVIDDYLKSIEKMAESLKGDGETVGILLDIMDSSYGYSVISKKRASTILRTVGA